MTINNEGQQSHARATVARGRTERQSHVLNALHWCGIICAATALFGPMHMFDHQTGAPASLVTLQLLTAGRRARNKYIDCLQIYVDCARARAYINGVIDWMA